ncbi:hypothetical protein [Streptomyces sp900129855]|uniref:Uncharacterized protein n=1 Tax=Streptomyces sp. 900129855 TaxID=3155129 RepID=A0ABV2ZLE6_9ACTN
MKPEGKEPDKKPQTIDLSSFKQFVTNIAEHLGEGWQLDTDNTSGPVAFLTHPAGHYIGLRRLWRGQAVQTWAIGVPPREYANEDDAKVMTANAAHLTEGHRYNAGVTFTHTSPSAATAKNIRTRLLPAYDGKRPPLRAFPKKPTRPKSTQRPARRPRKKAEPAPRETTTAAATRPRARKRKPKPPASPTSD